MMNELFNTSFEMSMRILLTLLVSGENSITVDMIAASDLMTTYGYDFNIADYNLHGENSFSFSAFAMRRFLSDSAIKQLVTNDLITVTRNQNGFLYKLSSKGRTVCNGFTTDYAAEYVELTQSVQDFIGNKTELEVIQYINKCAISEREDGK